MLDHTTLGFSTLSTCWHDPEVQRPVASTRAVPFRQAGHVACIEVVGVPALRCKVCGEQSYDLTLLARIESALSRRVEREDVRTAYLFEQLAAELTMDTLR